MQMPVPNKIHTLFLGVFGLLLVIAVSFFILADPVKNPGLTDPSPSPSADLETQTIGTLTCLPHKNKSGPITLECAYGLKTDNGHYYALDTTFFPGILTDFAIDVRVKVIGDLTNVEQASDTGLERYDIKGVIRVTDVERL